MATLETTFAGLKLRNPIIVSSSGLTDSAAKNQKLSEAGAGAIVLKSLFEEQIMMEADWMGDPNMYPEGSDYLVGYIREHKLGEYLNLIKESKKVCNIPIIASINCYQNADWVEFAAKIEEAGADALEINILALQTDVQYAYGSFENAMLCAEAGADFVGTTMRGYTPETQGINDIDFEFVHKLAAECPAKIIAEGHIHYPEQAVKALEAGAFALVVGGAITRPAEITARFTGAINAMHK